MRRRRPRHLPAPPAASAPGTAPNAARGALAEGKTSPADMKPVVDATPMKVPQLVRTAERGDHDATMKLLGAGADARETDADGTTALHWAAHFGDVELAKALLKAGADPPRRQPVQRHADVPRRRSWLEGRPRSPAESRR
jgi:hypothetical protein